MHCGAKVLKSRVLSALAGVGLTAVVFGGNGVAQEMPAYNVKYSWMLPKTVLDTTITYTFDSCANYGPGVGNKRGAHVKLKVSAAITPRAVPDTPLGRQSFLPSQLESFWQDRSINLKTFSGSHILNTIGSMPSSQAASITANILGGLVKLVAVGMGVPAVPLTTGPAPSNPPPAASECGSAQAIVEKIKENQGKLAELQTSLAGGVDDGMQKTINGQIQAYQTLIANLQAELAKSSIVIKRTIDPGYTAVDIAASEAEPDLLSKSPLPEPN